MSNELIIAVAGSGKTTHLVDKALKQVDGKTLIATYTEANGAEIKKKIIQVKGCIPENIVIQTWFSFLLQHGVRPFQGCIFDEKIKGMILVNRRSGIRYINRQGHPVPYKESDIRNFYFSKELKIYSDKIARFAFKCNEKSKGAVINRLSSIFDRIFIDEVQDLASYDLDILKLLFESEIDILMVGDPRQVVYVTHRAQRLNKYSPGKIDGFINEQCNDLDVLIDQDTLNKSHRNNAPICEYSSKLFPEYPASEPCICDECRVGSPHDGVFLVRDVDVANYLESYNPVQLRWSNTTRGISKNHRSLNMGLAKGKSFDRALIFPTNPMKDWIANNNSPLQPEARAKFYVGITRARHSVGIVYNFDDDTEYDGLEKYKPRK